MRSVEQHVICVGIDSMQTVSCAVAGHTTRQAWMFCGLLPISTHRTDYVCQEASLKPSRRQALQIDEGGTQDFFYKFFLVRKGNFVCRYLLKQNQMRTVFPPE